RAESMAPPRRPAVPVQMAARVLLPERARVQAREPFLVQAREREMPGERARRARMALAMAQGSSARFVVRVLSELFPALPAGPAPPVSPRWTVPPAAPWRRV